MFSKNYQKLIFSKISITKTKRIKAKKKAKIYVNLIKKKKIILVNCNRPELFPSHSTNNFRITFIK